jgi:bacillolysin
MGIFTKSAFAAIVLIACCNISEAQQESPQKITYTIQTINTVDGSKASNPKPYFMKQPSSISPAYQPATSLFITSPIPSFKNLSLDNPANAETMAFEFLKSISVKLQVSDAGQSFIPLSTQADNLGMSHVKMQQVYRGVPVFGAETIVHLKDGQEGVVNGKCIPEALLSDINTTPSIDYLTAQNTAIASVKTQADFTELTDAAKAVLKYNGPEKELVIFPDMHDNSKLNLCWHFTIRPNALERWEYFIDAQDGSIIYFYDNTCTDGPTTGQGTDLHNLTRGLNIYFVGTKYYLIDASKSMFNAGASTFPDNPAGAIRTVSAGNTDLTSIFDVTANVNTGWVDPSSVSAHYNAGICYDYYQNTFGRKGLDGNGTTMLSVVNVTAGGFAMDNAYWNGQLMAYGNGKTLFNMPLAAALDVTGHEMTHGVIQSTANLFYQDQPGAINESFADIFGCMIERKNWQIGEDVVNYTYFPSGALRDLSDPHNGASGPSSYSWQPAKMSEFVTTTGDHGGVHVNSGIPNFAFYKIATAVGKDTAEKIYYRALTLYLTRSSQFIDLRLAVVQASKDLFGANSKEVTAAKSAFDAVQIYDGTGNDFQKDLTAVYGSDMLMVHKAPYKDTAIYLVKPVNPTSKDFHPIVLNQAINKPSITDDGQRGYFIGADHNINKLAIDTTKFKRFLIGFTGYYWNNVAISKDSTKLALTRYPNDTSIWVLDIRNAGKITATKYHLFNPTYASGIQTGGPVYANTLEWDPTGEYVMYDSYNQIGSGSTSLKYWDVGFLKGWDNTKGTYGDGTITKLFASLPKGVDITNPVYSKNSPYIIAYDYFDEINKIYKIYSGNIEHGLDSVIYTNNTFGYPTFSKHDDMLAFTSINTNKDTIIAEIPLHANKMSPSGSMSALLKGYKWPVWYTRGLRNGIQALYNSLYNQQCEFNNNIFYSTSIGHVSTYSWSFGTNATPLTATTAGPISVVYGKPGLQTVTLTVKDSTGKITSTISNNIFVYAATVLSITEGANNLLTMNTSLPASNIQWYFNGVAITGANSNTLTATKSGNYSVSASASTGCVSTSPAYKFINSGIDPGELFSGIKIYPNPGHDFIKMEVDIQSDQKLFVSVFNSFGQSIYSENTLAKAGVNTLDVDMTGIAPGMYLVKFQAGTSTKTERIMIQR